MFRIYAVIAVICAASYVQAGGCGTARVGILQRHHERKAERLQARADHHANAANRIASRRGSTACTPATAPAVQPKGEQLPAPKK